MRVAVPALPIAALLLVAACSKDNLVETRDLCAAGEYSCQIQTLRVCNDSRTGWLEVAVCPTGMRCDAVIKDCVASNADAGQAGAAGGDGGDSGTGGGSASTGGAGGTAGLAGNDGGPVELEACDSGPLCVAKLVNVGGLFGIDATEVTRDQYADWLSAAPSKDLQPAYCSWNTTYAPTCEWPPAGKGGHPVVCVDWCDAFAYCKGVGKRLCGRIGGGSNESPDFSNATESQWYNACSSAGKHAYPYGDTPDAKACNGGDNTFGGTVSVGSLWACQSQEPGYEGVFDLSGNAWEWTDECTGTTDGSECRLRGGSFSKIYPLLHCAANNDYHRAGYFDSVGFRCCSDP